jgi:hypothetical protein
VQRSGVAGGEATAAAHNVAALEAAGDIAALVELLRCGDAAGMAAAAGVLQNLAYYSNASRVAIAEAGAVVPLVELLRCGDMEGKKAAGGALCNLALNNANQVAIVEAGAVAPLVELLRCGDAAGKLVAAGALGNLATGNRASIARRLWLACTLYPTTTAIVKAGAVAPLVELLCGDAAEKEVAAWTLWRLANNNNANRVAIVKVGAVAPLVELLLCGDAEGKLVAAGALRMLAFFNSANRAAIKAAKVAQGEVAQTDLSTPRCMW